MVPAFKKMMSDDEKSLESKNDMANSKALLMRNLERLDDKSHSPPQKDGVLIVQQRA